MPAVCDRVSHMREFLEQGFEVAFVKDATAAARLPEGDGYEAALINFRDMADTLWTTTEAVAAIKERGRGVRHAA